MLKFNTFRSDRYLRAKFVEGRYFLASEASDLELELMGALRRIVKSTIGDVAIDSAFEVSRLSQTQLLIKPGDAWFEGLPFRMRASGDQLVSGASLTLGIVPPGVTVTDDTSGTGKILTWTPASTPTGLYRIVISAQEQIITDVEDPFIKNANLTESTGQKIRLFYKINIVSDANQTETPIPYTNDTGSYNTTNLVNKIIITPGAGQNGEVLAMTPVSGSSQIDGRDLELTIRNDTGIGGGVKIPNGTTDQQAFFNGKLIDSLGNTYHVNAIFNDVISTQVIVRLDKEVGQPDPTITNGQPYELLKRDVYVTDDTNGSPVGRLFWPVASSNWDTTDGFVHSSVVTDLRTRVISEESFEETINQKFNIQLTGGGVIDVDIDGETLNWGADFTLVNPSGSSQTIAASSAVILDGGTLAYFMNFAGGLIAVGNLAVTVSSVLGDVVSLSGSPDLTTVKLGNVLKVGLESTAITEIDNVNKTVTVSPAITSTGSGTIYRDSFAEGTVALKENIFILAARSDRITVGGILELSAGESNAIYDVRTLFPSGLPAFTDIVIPDNSITGKPQYYEAIKRNLEVYQNQLIKYQGSDWISIDSQTIQFAFDLPNDTELHFRIDSLPAGSVGGGGSGGAGTLQEAYNGGNTISVTPGLPFSVSGGSGKIAEFLGDITVTGVIDPAGMELTPQGSNPLAVSAAGIWVESSGKLMHTDGTSEFNISQDIADLQSGASNPITAGSGLTKTVNDLSVNVDNSTIEIVTDILQLKDLGTTTAKLADASVDEIKLNSSVAGNGLTGGSGTPLAVVVDDSTIEIVTDALQVKDAGITLAKMASASVDENKLTTSVAGDGLSGGGGSPLSVNTDGSTLEIDTDALRIKDLGVTTAKIDNAAVDETKLSTSVAGDGLTGGAGTPLAVGAGNGVQVNADSIDVLYAPATKISAIAGESFLSNITYFVRWAVNGETAGRIYKADSGTASDKKYLAFGSISSTSAINTGDSVTITVNGTQILASGDGTFSATDIGKELFLRNNGSGGFTLTAPTTVGDAQFNVGTIQDIDRIFVNIKQIDGIVPEPTYDEHTLFPSGLLANTNITLPVNSRNGNAAQTYDVAAGRLLVYLNEVLKFQDLDTPANGDWIAIDDTNIQFNYDLSNDSEVHFRIEALASGVLSGTGGGGGNLQDAYDSGNAITTTFGNPLTVNGPGSGKIAVFNGDITVTGIVDPTAVQFTPQGSNPLGASQGIWVNTSNQFLFHDGTFSTNVSTILSDISSGYAVTILKRSYTNNTGSTIPSFTPIYSPTTGMMDIADGTDLNKYRVIGITTSAVLDSTSGDVAINGTVTGVMGFTHNRYIYLGLTPGTLTDTAPTLGPYPVGFQVIKIGVMDGTDLILQLQHVGTL